MDFASDLLTLFLPEVLVFNIKLTSHRKEGELIHLLFEKSLEILQRVRELKSIFERLS